MKILKKSVISLSDSNIKFLTDTNALLQVYHRVKFSDSTVGLINTKIESVHHHINLLNKNDNSNVVKTLKLLALSVILFCLILFISRLLRYYIKLNRHYKDRKLALELYNEDKENGDNKLFKSLEEAVMMISSAHIDFNMPKMPTDVLTQYYSAKNSGNKNCCCCCCKDCEEKKDDKNKIE